MSPRLSANPELGNSCRHIRATMPPPTQYTLRLAVDKEPDEYRARKVKLPFPSSLGKGPGDGVRNYSGVTYAAVMPPSTRKVLPVTKEDSSDARKRTASAISRASPKRPIGI